MTRVLFVFFRGMRVSCRRKSSGLVVRVPKSFVGCGFCIPNDFAGRVGERLKPADCKSAAPCGLRRFESFPVHQALVVGIVENRRAIASSDVRRRSKSRRQRRSGKVRREIYFCQLRQAGVACEAEGNGFGLGSSVGRARPW